MTSIETVKPRRSMLAKLAAGSLLAAGLLAAGIAPASADDDDWNNGRGKHHKRWKHNQGYNYGYYQARPPKVVYHYPAPVYYAPPPPVYYAPPPPVYYYPDRPRVSVDLVFPIRID